MLSTSWRKKSWSMILFVISPTRAKSLTGHLSTTLTSIRPCCSWLQLEISRNTPTSCNTSTYLAVPYMQQCSCHWLDNRPHASPTLQTIEGNCPHSNSNHGFRIVIELAADREQWKGVCRLRLIFTQKAEHYVIVKELNSVWSQIHRKKLQKRDVLRYNILIHEIQRSRDEFIDVVVWQNEN